MTVRQLLFLLGPRPRIKPPVEREVDGIAVEAE
jgi:hypothetical protein